MNPQTLYQLGKIRQRELLESVRHNQASAQREKPGRGPSVIMEIFGKRQSD